MGIFFPSLPDAGQPARPLFSIAGAAAAHAALIGFVAVVVPADELRKVIEPMTVRLVEILPDAPKPPPQPKKNLPLPPRQLLASSTPSEAPAAFAVPPQAPQPPSPVPAAPIDIAPASVAITAARFDADYLDNPKPVYPLVARRLGEQGKVLLRVHVSAAGLAEKVELKAGSGYARLDQAATDAVSRWRFVPARRGDQAIAAWVQVPITFQLES
jgi:protein TonB